MAVIMERRSGTPKSWGKSWARRSCLSSRFVARRSRSWFVSGLNAGGFKGAKTFQKRIDGTKFTLVSCGLADPKEEKTRREIERNARAAFKDWDGPLFCVRGAIDYRRLSVLHRVMMWMMKTMIVKKGLEAENEAFLATYGSRISFCSEDQLDPIVAYRQKNERF